MVKTKVLFVSALILFAACWWLGLRPPPGPDLRSESGPNATPAAALNVPTSAVRIDDGPLTLSVELDRSRVHFASRTLNALMTLQAKGRRTGPMALALVLDRSGSMGGLPIEKAREAARQVVDLLRDGDRLAIVSYAGDVTVEMPLTQVGPRRHAFSRAVNRVLDGGGTDLAAGLQAGIAQLSRADASMLRHVLVLSDGDSNQGLRGTEPLLELARQAQARGITVSTVGLGAGDFDGRLARIAAAGAGRVWRTEPLGLPHAFSSDLAELGRGELARNVRVRLTSTEGFRVADSSCPEQAPDVAPGETYQCRIHFELAPAASMKNYETIFAGLTYDHALRHYAEGESLDVRLTEDRVVPQARILARSRALEGRTGWIQVDGSSMLRTEAR